MSPICCSFFHPSHIHVCTLLLFGCGSFFVYSGIRKTSTLS
jgi:hypothetical protein